MEPISLGALAALYGGSTLLGTGASVYGANLQDKQNAKALAYQKERDALGDQRQAAQDRIAERMRQRQMLIELLERSKQQQQEYASQWNPAMARQPQPQAGA